MSSVSVLIPCRGDSPYITETLSSIENSVMRPSEVLIIDDGLSEAALKRIDRFSERLPILIKSSNGTGLVSALNTGLQSATSKYVCRIDNDDIMLPNRIERQFRELEGKTNLVAVASQCLYIDSTGQVVGKSSYPNGVINYHPDFNHRCLVAHPSSMYLTADARLIGGYRSIFRWNGTDIGEDFDFWLRLSQLGEIEIIDEPLIKYRQHAGQLSMTHHVGQSVGTTYISAVNLLSSETSAPTIDFHDGKSLSHSDFLRIIKKSLGLRFLVATRIVLFVAKHDLPEFSIIHRILRRLIFELSKRS